MEVKNLGVGLEGRFFLSPPLEPVIESARKLVISRL